MNEIRGVPAQTFADSVSKEEKKQVFSRISKGFYSFVVIKSQSSFTYVRIYIDGQVATSKINYVSVREVHSLSISGSRRSNCNPQLCMHMFTECIDIAFI